MAIDVRSRLGISDGDLEGLCGKWGIVRLELFGSALREDFDLEASDIDLLVTFEEGDEWSLLDLVHMEFEFSDAIGRRVDLIERGAIEESENYLRRKRILDSARPLYAR
ncbi:MAG: nucleotidyltransferase domain-containing protein [Dehalococcoidia bacterium]